MSAGRAAPLARLDALYVRRYLMAGIVRAIGIRPRTGRKGRMRVGPIEPGWHGTSERRARARLSPAFSTGGWVAAPHRPLPRSDGGARPRFRRLQRQVPRYVEPAEPFPLNLRGTARRTRSSRPRTPPALSRHLCGLHGVRTNPSPPSSASCCSSSRDLGPSLPSDPLLLPFQTCTAPGSLPRSERHAS